MKPDAEKIKSIFDYMSVQDENLEPADGAFVFCRADPLVAQRVAELFERRLVSYAVFTGGVGKDSGALAGLKCPEAVYQASLLRWVYGVPDNKIYVEQKARDGLENSEFGIRTMVDNNLPHKKLIIVAHSTSLRRLHAAHCVIAKRLGFKADYQLAGTGYKFDPHNPIDQKEAIYEILKLADFSSKGLCLPQRDLPMDLVSYARELNASMGHGRRLC